MNLKVGDIVSRKSYNHDILFKIIDITEGTAILKGIELRLYADSELKDLVKEDKKPNISKSDREIINENLKSLHLDRSEYFYLPGKILHIDGDEEYLERCINFYRDLNVKAYGITLKESEVYKYIDQYLNEYNPDILVITGHDAYYKKRNDMNNIENYQNSKNFIKAIKVARKYEKDQNKLIVISGACQSDYEELIKAGANFASSPKRINIHALDPAIIASSIALSVRNKSIDLISLIEKTKYGADGIGGIITDGTMYVGYPR
ncbi:MAG: sporulation peptidase YabG [Bacilli bacterium]|nr:sporulation peptidase YabG [Bacilli bacterium]